MKRSTLLLLNGSIAALLLAACAPIPPSTPQSRMSFFVTSRNPGHGADLGGLAGADQHCQALAETAGAGQRTWHAYLSTTLEGGMPGVNARDRIGHGPWHNAKGMLIARDLDELHGINTLTKQSALTEKGELVSGRGDPVNTHDMLTGSRYDGRATPGEADTTCHNWTSSNEGSAIVGHHDRLGLRDDAASISWNSSHATPGCSPEALKSVGGGGLLYCFAIN
jgi:hypothetical protein